jgi:cellulose synthase/poly-beta-1,6-N-acetylglucosamine synthase-like glycosyltransferase
MYREQTKGGFYCLVLEFFISFPLFFTFFNKVLSFIYGYSLLEYFLAVFLILLAWIGLGEEILVTEVFSNLDLDQVSALLLF